MRLFERRVEVSPPNAHQVPVPNMGDRKTMKKARELLKRTLQGPVVENGGAVAIVRYGVSRISNLPAEQEESFGEAAYASYYLGEAIHNFGALRDFVGSGSVGFGGVIMSEGVLGLRSCRGW